jgi:hypothetical protein
LGANLHGRRAGPGDGPGHGDDRQLFAAQGGHVDDGVKSVHQRRRLLTLRAFVHGSLAAFRAGLASGHELAGGLFHIAVKPRRLILVVGLLSR